MQINTNNLVSMTEANQNFSKVAKLVDERGPVIILKNNAPRYVIIEYTTLEDEIKEEKNIAIDQTVEEVAKQILTKHLMAFKELAK